MFFEDFCKITLVFKSDCDGNIQDRIIGMGQKAFAFLNPYKIQVIFESSTAVLLEEGGKIRRAEMNIVCDFFQCQRFGIM